MRTQDANYADRSKADTGAIATHEGRVAGDGRDEPCSEASARGGAGLPDADGRPRPLLPDRPAPLSQPHGTPGSVVRRITSIVKRLRARLTKTETSEMLRCPWPKPRHAPSLALHFTPTDRLMLAYTGTMAGLALTLHPRSAKYRVLALKHLGVAGGIIGLAALHRSRGGTALSFVRHTYSLVLLGHLHYWGCEMALVLCPRFLDREVIRLDRLVFRKDLHALLPRRFPGYLTRQIMNAAYFSFYPLIAGVFLSTWLWRRDRMEESVFTFSLCMYSHFLFFSLVPVVGPTHLRETLFPEPRPLMERIVKHAVDHGSKDGGALPSSHVAGSVALTGIVGRLFGRRAMRRVGTITSLLSVSTVYTSMHYPIDVVAGLGTGIGMFKIGPSLHNRMLLLSRRPAEVRELPSPPLLKLAHVHRQGMLLSHGTESRPTKRAG